jgi:hypothetical protein
MRLMRGAALRCRTFAQPPYPFEVRLEWRRWIRRILDRLPGLLQVFLDDTTGRLHDQHTRLCVVDVLERVWRTARCEEGLAGATHKIAIPQPTSVDSFQDEECFVVAVVDVRGDPTLRRILNFAQREGVVAISPHDLEEQVAPGAERLPLPGLNMFGPGLLGRHL